MDSNENSYRRGQIFGFTVAEILTLLLFILLLALAARIINIDKDKEEALDIADVTRKEYKTFIENVYTKIAPDSEVKIIRESFRKAIEEEQDKLKQDQLRFKELERILLAAGDDFFDEANTDQEKIEKMREALNLSGSLLDSGINQLVPISHLVVFLSSTSTKVEIFHSNLKTAIGQVIQVHQEQMLVTGVNESTLLVQRGYAGTLPTDHATVSGDPGCTCHTNGTTSFTCENSNTTCSVASCSCTQARKSQCQC